MLLLNRFSLTFFFTSFSLLLTAQIDPFKGAHIEDVIPISALSKEKIDTAIIEEIVIPTLSEKDRLAHELDSLVDAEIGFKLPIITCRQLHELQQNQNNNQKLYILDARDGKEYAISHIAGARCIGLTKFSVETVWTYNRKATIVIYSLNGEQGETIGLQMREMGFKNVYNLYGSLVEWVNQGLPVVDAEGKPTKKVFMRNKTEAKALKKGKAVY